MKRLIPLSVILLVFFATVFGCGFGVSVQGRIDAFLDALNNDNRTDMYLNLDPNLTNYDLLKDPAYWGVGSTDGWFPTVGVGTPYSFLSTFLDTTSNPDVPYFSANLSGPGGYGPTKFLEMTFVMVGLNWMIESITLAGNPVVPYTP